MEDNAYRLRKPHYVRQQFNSHIQANPRNRGKFCSHSLLKFLLIALFLSVLPLFPSQAPEFISHTAFAKTWELFHLLIIGIALSYGLFCRPKTPLMSPKPQISKPYVTNILHHSSIFDYENENPSGFLEKDAIPTQSCNNPSYYRTEPYVVVKRDSCKSHGEKPLGLPIRSLRSRVLSSDSDEESVSECESDLSGISRSGKDESLERNEDPISWKSRSMRVDFLAENGNVGEKFEPKELKSKSFRSQTQASCQRNYGFCSWLPESPNLHQQQQQQQQQQQHQQPVWIPPLAGSPNMEGQNSWRGENFSMPFSEFSTQENGYTMMGMPPNLDKRNLGVEMPMYFVPSTVAPASMSAPTDVCSSYSHDVGNLGVEMPMYFVPPTVAPASVSARTDDCSSYSHRNVNLGQASIFENGNLGGEKSSFFMPSAAAPSSISVPDEEIASSIKPLRSRKFKHENVNLGRSPNLENGLLGEAKASSFMPSAAVPSSVSVPEKDAASSLEPSRSRKFKHENVNLGQSSNLENGLLSEEKADSFIPSAAVPSSVSVPDKNGGSSLKPATSRKFKHENVNLGQSSNLENSLLGEEQVNYFIPSAAVPSSVSVPDKDGGSLLKPSRSRKFKHENENLGQSSNLENGLLDEEKAASFMPSAAAPSSVSVPDKDVASSIKPSRPRKFNHENGNLGKPPNLESGNVGGEKLNSFMPSAAPHPSVLTPENDVASSMKRSKSRRTKRGEVFKKDEQEKVKDNVENLGEGDDSSTPHFVDPNSVPTPRHDFASPINGSSLKNDEQRSTPRRWDDDCFVIPSTENIDVGNMEQENEKLSHGPTSSEPASSSGSSSRRSSNEQESLPSIVEEHAPVRPSTIGSEIEDLGKDNDSYKPSTPSPPPQVQTRRDDFISSVESSSNALVIGSLLTEDDDQGSPPTPERKTLSKASHSRRFSCGFIFDRDQRRSSNKHVAKEANIKKNKGSDQYASRGVNCGWDCLKLDMRPNLSKAALKGKSVRTIKPREIPLATNDKRELPEGKKHEKKEMMVIQIGITEKRTDSNGRKGEKRQGSGVTSVIVGLNSKESSKGKEAALSEVKEEETDSDEIDKKASEFIAKFKEQIRLQKVAAMAESSRQQQHTRQN